MVGYVVNAGILLSQIGSSVVKCVKEKGKARVHGRWQSESGMISTLISSPLLYGDVFGKLDQRLGSSL
jgi:hypothetical protein